MTTSKIFTIRCPNERLVNNSFVGKKWLAFVRECLLFDLICLGVGIGGTICGLICGDTVESAIVRFAYGVFGVVLGAVYGFARAIWYLFRESMYGEIHRSEPVPGERQNQWLIALSGLAGGVAFAFAIQFRGSHQK